jgi:TetR/AcrR family transcriptional repressor of uid operon
LLPHQNREKIRVINPVLVAQTHPPSQRGTPMETPKQARSVATLQRILDAALSEFRRSGFRGAGIAAICKAAGVSAGNLYHYFAGKEEIVAAIVERDRAAIQGEIGRLLAASDPLAALTTALLADDRPEEAGPDPVMTLEIYAEATRNPAVARIVRDSELQARGEAVALLAALRDRGVVSPKADLASAAALLMALVDGLMIRRMTDPTANIQALAPMLRAVLATLAGRQDAS